MSTEQSKQVFTEADLARQAALESVASEWTTYINGAFPSFHEPPEVGGGVGRGERLEAFTTQCISKLVSVGLIPNDPEHPEQSVADFTRLMQPFERNYREALTFGREMKGLNDR